MDPGPINRVALACVQCRSRHVKCDSTQPVCNRCRRDGKECAYQKSRRGGLRKEQLARRKLALQQQVQRSRNATDSPEHDHQSSTASSQSAERDGAFAGIPNFNDLSLFGSALDASNTLAFQFSTDRLLDHFYEHFWPGIPVTLPLHYINQRKMRENNGMDNLLLVLQWIGSIYAAWSPSEPYYEAALRALSRPMLPRTPFNVQALMYFAIAQYHWDCRQDARRSLDAAIAIALELQMNTKEFARAYGEGNPVLEESWRRTWYILRLTDQHFAVAVNNPIYALRAVPDLVDLPCEDEYYESGQIPTPATWQQYETRELDDVEVIYSSLTYLADISRVLAYVMKTFVETGQFGESLVSAVDTKIAVWQSLLPTSKRDPQRRDGKVDEVMFMAHMRAAIVSLTVHRPFSSLTYSVEELSTESFVSPVPFIEPLKSGRSVHTARALKAIDLHTKLLAIPCTVERHHLFSVCVAAVFCAAQISACKNLLEDHAASIARDRVRLCIGFINTMGSLWPLAKKMAKEVRFIARQTLPAPQIGPEVDLAAEIEIPRDELIWPLNPSAQIDIYSGIVLPGTWDQGMMNYASSSTSSLS